jgi:hypothetical protein
MSPNFKFFLCILLGILVLFAAMACSTTHVGSVATMPPCNGVWLSTNGGESYRCVSDEAFQRWRKANGL